jgi:hypothetical protein
MKRSLNVHDAQRLDENVMDTALEMPQYLRETGKA